MGLELWILWALAIPELWILAVVPALGLLVAADAVMRVSAELTKRFRKIRVEAVLLATLAGELCLLIALLAIKFPVFAIVDYDDPDLMIARINLIRAFVRADVAIVILSVLLTAYLCRRYGRSLAWWLPIAILGNWGAVFWLIRNRCAPQAAL